MFNLLKTSDKNLNDKFNGEVLNIEKWIGVLKSLKTWLSKRRFIDTLIKNCELLINHKKIIPLKDVHLTISFLQNELNKNLVFFLFFKI